MIRRLLFILVLLATGVAVGYFPLRKPAEKMPEPATFEQISQRRIARVELHQTTIGEAIRTAREVTGVGTVATWTSEDKMVIRYDAQIDPDISLHDVSVWQFLDRLNRSMGEMYSHPRFAIDDGYLSIRPVQGEQPDFGQDDESDYHDTETCVYDVETLMLDDGPWERLAMTRHGEALPPPPLRAVDRDDLLVTTIRELIASDSWKDAGGTIGSLRIMQGRLIVTQTMPNQQAIYEVIKTLRAAR